jgi:small neutral amino acid transporter SnatA (MarC family)
MLSGAFGIGFGLFYLVWLALFAGLVVLMIRFIASWGGSISRVFGEFGAEVFAQFIGWCLLPIALWVTIDGLITASQLGLF